MYLSKKQIFKGKSENFPVGKRWKISNIFFDPQNNLPQHIAIAMSISKEDYLKQLRIELHKPVKKNFPRRKVYVPSVDYTWAADLVDMKALARYNGGHKWILNVMDVWSRYAWSVPMKTKSAVDVVHALKRIVSSSKRKPKRLWVDQGTEFYNSEMTKYLDKLGTKRYSSFGEGKSVMVERLNRTLKQRMWQGFTERQTHNWIDHQADLLEWYNHKPHRGIGNRTPYSMARWPDAVPDNEFCLQPKPESFLKPKFKIGDTVRISNAKGIFGKGYTAGWSQEQFIVTSVTQSWCDDPPVYTLKDWYFEPIRGTFYEQQMQLVKYANVFLVEKVIKHDKKNKQLLVKWVGFDSTHNKWIPESNVLDDDEQKDAR